MIKDEKHKATKPILISVAIKDTTTNTIIANFAPTRVGEARAERYRGLAGLEIVKTYEKGGKKYESN